MSGFYHQEIESGLLQNVTGILEQNVQGGPMMQTVRGRWIQKARGELKQSVSDDMSLSVDGALTQTVGKDFNLTVEGDFNQEINQNHKWIGYANVESQTFGFNNTTFLGESMSLAVGVAMSVFGGLRTDISNSLSVSIGLIVRQVAEVTSSSSTIAMQDCKVSLTKSDFFKAEGGAKIESQSQLAVYKGPFGLWQRDMTIFK